MNDQPIPTTKGPELFLLAAWTHVQTFLQQKGHVPDVMILGRYADEQLMFVFPSSQDRDHFAQACMQQSAEFQADIAMMACEGSFHDGAASTDIACVFWRERTTPIRLQWAAIGREHSDSPAATMGAVSSMAGQQENRFLAGVFPGTLH